MKNRRWRIAAVLAAPAILAPAGCKRAGSPRAAEDDAGAEREIAAALESDRLAEAARAEPPSPPPPPKAESPSISCGGWVGSSSPESCLYLWSSCSDGLDRQMRCERANDGYSCLCLTGLRTPIHFRSADLCIRDTGIMSIDRARSSAIARGACGFDVHE